MRTVGPGVSVHAGLGEPGYPRAMAIATRPAAVTRRLSVDDAIRMSEAGILAETERVELVEGVLVEMSPEGQRHIGLVASLTQLFVLTYAPEHGVSIQSTLWLHEHGFRVPDVVVTDAPISERPPRPEEIALVLEVADSSLASDLQPKARDYAVYGVPEYWVLDLRGRRLVAHSEPEGEGYLQVRTLAEDAVVTLPRTAVTARVADLLAPAR